MSVVYVSDPGCQIGVEGNRIQVKYKDGMVRMIPIETVEGITMLGISQLTTKCMEECLRRGITVSFLSKGGSYFGRLVSTGHVRAALQRKQSALYDTDFALQLAQNILRGKMHNQRVVLSRYAASRHVNVYEQIQGIRDSERRISTGKTISEVTGFEGIAARKYFEGLSKCIEPEFRFHGRNRRPPRDEFNSMISLGYSIILNEIYSELEVHGLNPYFGFIHRDAENHPTLASDLMEEWRAVLIDSTVMSMINGHEIGKDEFTMNLDQPGCFIARSGLSKYLKKLEQKFNTRVKYFDWADGAVSFRYGISLQIESLIRAIDTEDVTQYRPLTIR